VYFLCRERALEVTGNQGVEPAMEWFVILIYFLLQLVLTVHVRSGYERML
jgi:hypothetical protein